MIKLRNVSYLYRGQTQGGLRDISLTIPKGQFVLLCGESGCGKTTITRLINGLIPHFYKGDLSGSLEVCGLAVTQTHIADLSDHIGSVFQNPRTQFFNTDVNSEIVFGLENRSVPPHEMETRLNHTITELHIEGLANRSIFDLSGGEKQKVAFASVYASRPEILVLDEPSSNLDLPSVQQLSQLLATAKREGKTIVIAEHRLWYLTELADRVIYMKDGMIKQDMPMASFAEIPSQACREMGLRCRSLSNITTHDITSKPHPPTLEARNITVKFAETPVLNDVTFRVQAGEIVAIAGSNGAGKTTLARALCGLQKIESGTIALNNTLLSEKDRQTISYMVMQDVGHQLFSESVADECMLGLKNPDEKEVTQALKLLDLYELRERHPLSLSGGQKQRLAVAVSLVCEKDVLIFDEPTSGLDLKSQEEVSKLLHELSRRGKILLVITHDFELIQSCCSRVLLLHEGTIAADLPANQRSNLQEFWKE